MPSAQELRASLPQHRRLPDLLAVSDDPHPRKTRRVEWVGEENPLDNELILAKLLMGAFTPLQAKGIRRAAAFAKTRVGGARTRLMEHNHRHSMAVVNGLSRTYHFSALNNFICDVDYRDVDLLLGDPYAGQEFVDLDDLNRPPKVIAPSPQVFKLISQEVLDRDTDVVPRGFKLASH